MATKKISNQDRLAAIREKLKHTDVGSGRGGFWSPKVGKNVIRILPEVGEMQYFFQEVGKHAFPPDGRRSVYCPNFTSNGELDCPVCELVDELRKAGDKASKNLASQLKLRKSYWMNVIDRSNEDAGTQIYTPGVIVFGSLVGLINDPDYGLITSIDDGFDVTIERTGTGRDTEYEVRPKPRHTPLHEDPDIIKEWLENAKDLTVVEVSEDPEEDKELTDGHVVWVMPYDRIIKDFDLDNEEAISSMGDNSDDDEEPRSSKKTSKSSASSKRKPAPVEKDDDEDDDEDAEEEPPAKAEVRRRVAARHRR